MSSTEGKLGFQKPLWFALQLNFSHNFGYAFKVQLFCYSISLFIKKLSLVFLRICMLHGAALLPCLNVHIRHLDWKAVTEYFIVISRACKNKADLRKYQNVESRSHWARRRQEGWRWYSDLNFSFSSFQRELFLRGISDINNCHGRPSTHKVFWNHLSWTFRLKKINKSFANMLWDHDNTSLRPVYSQNTSCSPITWNGSELVN